MAHKNCTSIRGIRGYFARDKFYNRRGYTEKKGGIHILRYNCRDNFRNFSYNTDYKISLILLNSTCTLVVDIKS